MTTLNEIAYFVAGRFNKSSDDKFVREVAFAVKYWRAFLIRQDIEKNSRSPLYFQKIIMTLGFVPEDDNCELPGECEVLRTTAVVPEPIRTKTRTPFQYVGTDNNRVPFSYVSYDRLPYQEFARFTGKRIFYTYYNGYIYLLNTKKLEYLAVASAFVDPIAAGEVCINQANCVNNNSSFFAPADMVKTIIDGLLSGTFSMTAHEDQEVNVV